MRSLLIVAAILALAGAAFYALIEFGPRRVEETKPQTPSPPFPYAAEEVVVENPDAGVALAGTLTVPANGGPAPAVLLLSVAGPNGRDQSYRGHHGFWVLADYLTRRGVAVLRLDDRGVGGSTGDYLATDFAGLADDAAAAVDYLASHPAIDGGRVGVIGMSEGGAIGALAAARTDALAFLVLLSAPGLPGVEALGLQLEKTLEMSNIGGERADAYRRLFDEFVSITASDPADPSARERLARFLEGPGAALVPAYGFVPRSLDARVEFFLGPWYRSNLAFDPATAYGALAVPVLAIGGEKDPVAPPESHLAALERILDLAPTDDVTVVTLAGLNHLLQEAGTGFPDEYARLETTISPAALETIGDWIVSRAE